MGVPYGAPNDPLTFAAMVNNLPPNAVFSAFSIGRYQLAYAAQSVLFGGNVRVGLEDNIYLSKGVLASNGQLVDRAKTILEGMNVRLKTAPSGSSAAASSAAAGQRGSCSAATTYASSTPTRTPSASSPRSSPTLARRGRR